MTMTRSPASAQLTARLVARLVLPSPGLLDVTSRTGVVPARSVNCTLARTMR